MAHKKLTKKRKALADINVDKIYTAEEALPLLRRAATAKFDETLELAINLGVDPRHADQVVRGVCPLPNGTGKNVRVAVFARGPKADEARAAGADLVGAEDLAEQVSAGIIDFDRCIATPDMMMIIGKLGKILGPRGLMPNPKVGTVTGDPASAVKAVKSGTVEFRCEKAGIVHAGVGKISFTDEALLQNVRALYDAVAKARPAGVKGAYIKRAALSTSQGVGLKIELASLVAATGG